MSWGFKWRPYVPVAARRAQAGREMQKLAKTTGHTASPVQLDGRKIAHTFWGKAWCDNLEAYSDYANRLPRGRSYVRNGSVVDLQIGCGKITARVSGSSLYQIEIKIKPLQPALWKSIQTECAGKIDSLIELLQGRLSSSVMQMVTRPKLGLFPTPGEIDMDCSCPDWADLCKHVAATLYGVGARLDQSPELLFKLRGLDPADLISQSSAAEAVRQSEKSADTAAMSEAEISDVFGIELASRAGGAGQPQADPNPLAAGKPPPLPPPQSRPAGTLRQKTGQIKRLADGKKVVSRAGVRVGKKKMRRPISPIQKTVPASGKNLRLALMHKAAVARRKAQKINKPGSKSSMA